MYKIGKKNINTYVLLRFLSFASHHPLGISFKSTDAFCSKLTMPFSNSMRKKSGKYPNDLNRERPEHIQPTNQVSNVCRGIRSACSRYVEIDHQRSLGSLFAKSRAALSFYFLNSFVYTFSVRVMFSCSIPPTR